MDDATLAALRTAASALFDVGLATMIGALATAALLRDASSMHHLTVNGKSPCVLWPSLPTAVQRAL
jgi:hypothetical protein